MLSKAQRRETLQRSVVIEIVGSLQLCYWLRLARSAVVSSSRSDTRQSMLLDNRNRANVCEQVRSSCAVIVYILLRAQRKAAKVRPAQWSKAHASCNVQATSHGS